MKKINKFGRLNFVAKNYLTHKCLRFVAKMLTRKCYNCNLVTFNFTAAICEEIHEWRTNFSSR